jgi:hypothetical protein
MGRYKVFYRDNFHYMDEGEGPYTLDEFDDCASAVAACKRMVDEFLAGAVKSDSSFEALFKQYTTFGEEPFIVSDDPACSFSGRSYAESRCRELCGGEGA